MFLQPGFPFGPQVTELHVSRTCYKKIVCFLANCSFEDEAIHTDTHLALITDLDSSSLRLSGSFTCDSSNHVIVIRPQVVTHVTSGMSTQAVSNKVHLLRRDAADGDQLRRQASCHRPH